MEYIAMRRIFCLLILIMACSGFGHAQTQDWTGVPQPGNDPQLQQLYAQAVAQANQTYAAAQQYMPNTAGVGAQYTAWVKESTILFDAKWDYWQLLNPHGAMTNNPQYMKDWAAYQSQCFPQCPNFANSGSANAGGKSTNPTAPINTINQSLYGAAALSRGLVSPTAEAQQEADAEATDLLNEVASYQPSGGEGSQAQNSEPEDPLDYNGPRELDFNRPETLPDSMPGVSVIIVPDTGSNPQAASPCMTIATCTAAMSDLTDSSYLDSNNAVSSPSAVGAGTQPTKPILAADSQTQDDSTQAAFVSVASQINSQANQDAVEAAQETRQRAQENTEGLKDLAEDAVISALDQNGATARLTTDFGTEANEFKSLLAGEEDQTHPIDGMGSYLKDQISTKLMNAAYDKAQDALLDKATTGMDEGDKLNTVFDSVLAPSSFVSLTKLKDNFFKYYGPAMDSFFGVVKNDSDAQGVNTQ
jgi:hypothetical protein